MNKIALIHASRVAVDPVMRYYSHTAPDLEITNLLDDGVTRLFRVGDLERVRLRLAEMIATARDVYGADAAVLTCSAAPPDMLAQFRRATGMGLLKIDEPMCHDAVQAGLRIGLLVSFPPTSAATRALLAEAAAGAGKTVEIVEEQAPEALEELLAGDQETHEELLVAAADRLARQNPDAIVLAQVSMARMAPRLTARLGVPVFSSLASSLDALRARF